MSLPLDEFQKTVGEWGKETFPNSTIRSITLHLKEESDELHAFLVYWEIYQMPDRDDKVWSSVIDELCDCVLLSLHLAERSGFSLMERLEERFREVQARKWDDGARRGYSKHIEEAR